MKTGRRSFLKNGAAIAAGAAIAGPGTRISASRQADFQVTIRFSGLLMHGRRLRPGRSDLYSKWHAFLLERGGHKPQLKIPEAYVSGTGYTRDRQLPGYFVWDIANSDVTIELAGATTADVQVTKNPRTGTPCPDPANDSEFEYVDWLLDFTEVLGGSYGTLKEILTRPDDIDRTADDCLKVSRLQLPGGTMVCRRPSREAYETKTLLFKVSGKVYERFSTDITEFTSNPASGIKVKIRPLKMPETSATIITLAATSTKPIPIIVENNDESLLRHALDGTMSEEMFWKEHFKPYLELLDELPMCSCDLVPTISCCRHATVDCDPPFYCVPGGGTLP